MEASHKSGAVETEQDTGYRFIGDAPRKREGSFERADKAGANGEGEGEGHGKLRAAPGEDERNEASLPPATDHAAPARARAEAQPDDLAEAQPEALAGALAEALAEAQPGAQPETSKSAAPIARASDEGLAALEPLLEVGDYRKLCAQLGPTERAASLPPASALLYAIAQKETGQSEDGHAINLLAIRSVAQLLGVREDSHIALTVAKRILRSHRSGWKKKAPKAPARLAIVTLALAFGAVVGWMMGPGGVQFAEVVSAAMR